MNKNEDVYSRFGLSINREKAQQAFTSFCINKSNKELLPVIYPGGYEDREQLDAIRSDVYDDLCYQLFIDPKKFEDDTVFRKNKFEDLLSYIFNLKSNDWPQCLCNLQIFMNTLFEHKFVRWELSLFAANLVRYINDYPILGIRLKEYKTKPPQLFPAASPVVHKNINTALDILEKKKFANTIQNFEHGLKLFLGATKYLQFKGVAESMHGACDELIKELTGHKNKGFKHVFDGKEYLHYGLNGSTKEMYKNFEKRLNDIKHGTEKNINRDELRTIVSMTASFIQLVANHYKP